MDESRSTAEAQTWPLLTFAIRRRPATLRGAGRRILPFWGATAAGYGVVLAVGLPGQQGNLGYWVPASLAVGAPLVVAAWRESRA
ncbi:MAG: hypothetical protein WAL50_16055 [Kineosporiaceae bacterium]